MFISQLDWCFIVLVGIIFADAKVADTESNSVMISGRLQSELGDLPLEFVAMFVAEDDVHPRRDDVEGALGVRVIII